MTDNDTTEIYYVPGAQNQYIPATDTVVLDERLKDYPGALMEIREHELKHAEIGDDIVGQALMELRNDVGQTFRDDELMREINEYYAMVADSGGSTALRVTNFLRSFWMMVLGPIRLCTELRRQVVEEAKTAIRRRLPA